MSGHGRCEKCGETEIEYNHHVCDPEAVIAHAVAAELGYRLDQVVIGVRWEVPENLDLDIDTNGVSINVELSPSAARELAERIFLLLGVADADRESGG